MNLIRTELRKIIHYPTFWTIMAIYVLLQVLLIYFSSNLMVSGQSLGKSLYDFPNIWMRFSYIAYFFNLLLGILLIVLITDEYSFRTLRQQVIDGRSRAEAVLAKFYVTLGLAAAGTVFLLAMGLLFGLIYSTNTSIEAIFSKIDYLSYFFVQAVGYMCLAMFFAFLIRKSGLAIIAFLAWSKIVEPIIHYQMDDRIDRFMPMKVFGSLTPTPGQELIDGLTSPTMALSPGWAVLPALVYIALLVFGSILLVRLRDL
ncbi:ABC transporter permease [Pontibacter ramchanderi]|uniref:ABC-2 family transporter n=1 Tax=Pontibacter ramchanderi TaxID=1179743 RepID=A0A2N3U8X4_9BACT|nr:ABC transporter permease [Pontibacter ramchanderi]PKV63200.1 ABC-2 family transporter [Pontibacter ramchanderi]